MTSTVVTHLVSDKPRLRGIPHSIGALVAIPAAIFCVAHAAKGDETMGATIYGLSLIFLLSASAIYHTPTWKPRIRMWLRRVDHSAIFVLIAGSYTPIAAIVLDGWLRWIALGTVWGITAVGTAQKLYWPQLGHGYSVALQVAQGWLAVLLLVPLYERLGWPAVGLLVLGGFFYTLGMVAFTTQRPRLWPHVFSYHEIFHVLVVGGSASHYAMTFLYVARFGAA